MSTLHACVALQPQSAAEANNWTRRAWLGACPRVHGACGWLAILSGVHEQTGGPLSRPLQHHHQYRYRNLPPAARTRFVHLAPQATWTAPFMRNNVQMWTALFNKQASISAQRDGGSGRVVLSSPKASASVNEEDVYACKVSKRLDGHDKERSAAARCANVTCGSKLGLRPTSCMLWGSRNLPSHLKLGQWPLPTVSLQRHLTVPAADHDMLKSRR